MKKIIVSVLLVGAIALYVIFRSTASTTSTDDVLPPTTTKTEDAPPSAPSGGTSVGSKMVKPPASILSGPVPATEGPYKDGSYTGDAVDAFYGIVQVQATVSGGKLTKIDLLKFPNDRENTIRISNESFPVLIKEAVLIQSAHVDIISGATQTSEGFQASLASALKKAS